MTMVLMAPNRKRNSLWSSIFKNCFPIKAAWEAPNPGRKAVNGAAIIEARDVFAIDFLDSLILVRFVVFCMGIFVFCFILIMRLLAPKSPVNKGNKGSFIFKFSEAIPRKPARRKIIRAQSFLLGSVVIR